MATLYGSYQATPGAMGAVGRWISENEREVAAPMFNILQVGPRLGWKPEQWAVDVRILVGAVCAP